MSGSGGTEFNYTNTSIADGSYDFIVSCNDTQDNFGATDVYEFYVDTVYPSVNFTSPTPNNDTTQTNTDIFVNVSASDSSSNVSTFIDFDGDLVGWWRMDDINSSGDPEDYTDKSNDGVIVGNANQTDAGKLGKGFDFDGAGDSVRIATTPVTDPPLTICTWFKTEITNIQTVASIADDNGVSMYHSIEITVASKILARTKIDGFSTAFATATKDYAVGTWHHVCGVWAATNDRRIFVDGGNNASETTNLVTSGIDVIGVGRLEDNSKSTYFNGTIDDVMIFNRTLSAEEIIGLYANTSTKYLTHNFTGLADGNHTFTAYSQDYGGNVNSTLERQVTTNAIPSVSLSWPLDGVFDTNRTPEFNWTGSDAGGGPSSLQYEINLTCWEGGSVVTAGSVYKDKSEIGTATRYIPVDCSCI
jgi:hypothetical protein